MGEIQNTKQNLKTKTKIKNISWA